MLTATCYFPKLDLTLDVLNFIGREEISATFCWWVTCIVSPGFSRRCVGQIVELHLAQASDRQRVIEGIVTTVNFQQYEQRSVLELAIEPVWLGARHRTLTRLLRSVNVKRVLTSCWQATVITGPGVAEQLQTRDWLQYQCSDLVMGHHALAQSHLAYICHDDGSVELQRVHTPCQKPVVDIVTTATQRQQIVGNSAQMVGLSRDLRMSVTQVIACEQQPQFVTRVIHLYRNPAFHSHALVYTNLWQATERLLPCSSSMAASAPLLVAEVVANDQHNPHVAIHYPWDHENAISAVVPWLTAQQNPHASTYAKPEVGDQVLVRYRDSNPQQACIVGSLSRHSKSALGSWDAAGMVTTKGQQLLMTDADGGTLRLHSPGNINLTSRHQLQLVTDEAQLQASTQAIVSADHGTITINAERIEFTVANSVIELTKQRFTCRSAMHVLRAASASRTWVSTMQNLHRCITDPSGTPHANGVIGTGSENVLVNELRVARVGDHVSCLAGNGAITTGCSAILVNGKAVAVRGSKTQHGGEIITGTNNVVTENVIDAPDDVMALIPQRQSLRIKLSLTWQTHVPLLSGDAQLYLPQTFLAGRIHLQDVAFYHDTVMTPAVFAVRLQEPLSGHSQVVTGAKQRLQSLQRTRLQ